MTRRWPPASPQPDPRLAAVYAAVRDQVEDQLRQVGAHDIKAGILTAFSGAIAVALGSFAITDDLSKRGHGELTLLGVTAVAIGISLVAAFIGLWPRDWRRDPDPDALLHEYSGNRYADANSLLGELTANLQENFTKNKPGIRVKVLALRVAQTFLGVALLIAVMAAVAHLLCW